MSLYTNFSYASLDEVYGPQFKSKSKKSSKNKKIVVDPATPEYDIEKEHFELPRKEQFQISKDLYKRSKDFTNPWDHEYAYTSAAGGTFNPYEDAQAMINPQNLEQQQYRQKIFAEPNIYNYSTINRLPDGEEKKPLPVLNSSEGDRQIENFQMSQFKRDVQIANIFIHVAFGIFVLYILEKLIMLGKLLSK